MSVSSVQSLLNNYDPTNPSSIDSALTGAGLSDGYYQQGVNGTGSFDPGTVTLQAPPLAAPANAAAATGQSPYAQALSSLQDWSDQTLIQSALGGLGGTSEPGDDSSTLASTLEEAAQAQASTQAAQQQAALAAAQNALEAGTNVDTTA